MIYFYPCMPNRVAPDSVHFKELDRDPKWIGEVKKNGWRCLTYRNATLELWTRRKTLIKDPLPCLRQELMDMLPEGTIIDGELLEKRTKEIKGRYYIFDVLMFRNVPIYSYKWSERRLILEELYFKATSMGSLELSLPVNIGKEKLYLDNISSDDVEGIVLKKMNSPYPISLTSCTDNPFWIKIKRPEKSQYAERRKA
jgi:ATP-dependent DNA ligase